MKEYQEVYIRDLIFYRKNIYYICNKNVNEQWCGGEWRGGGVCFSLSVQPCTRYFGHSCILLENVWVH
jgi:hypothetical protein